MSFPAATMVMCGCWIYGLMVVVVV